MKRILVLSPTHMNLYKDIVEELENEGFYVEFIAVKSFPNDPFYIHGKYHQFFSKNKFLSKLEKYWISIYESGKYTFDYDYLLVINGTTVHPILFELLKKKNKDIITINYLFDSTQRMYHFDRNFQYYDRIYSFDRSDVELYNLNFLPIYWKPCESNSTKSNFLFGFGAFNRVRYKVFSYFDNLIKDKRNESFIKLYYPQVRHTCAFFAIKYIKKLFKIHTDITKQEYCSELITHQSMSPDEFRNHIWRSKIVIDTSNGLQDGLTARFMWAVGAGKKIVTTNTSIRDYDIYSKDQFFIIDNINSIDVPSSFLETPFNPKEGYWEIVNNWRIDLWLKQMLYEGKKD